MPGRVDAPNHGPHGCTRDIPDIETAFLDGTDYTDVSVPPCAATTENERYRLRLVMGRHSASLKVELDEQQAAVVLPVQVAVELVTGYGRIDLRGVVADADAPVRGEPVVEAHVHVIK